MLRIAAVLHATGRVAGSVRIVRAPLLVALIGAVGLAVPEQSREILRVHALDFHKQLAQVGSGFLFLTLAAFAVWRMAKNLAEIDSTRAESACIGVLAWLPLVCGMLLPVGMAGALFWSSQELGRQELPKDVLAALSGGEPLPEFTDVAAALQRLLIGAVLAMAIALTVAVAAVLYPPRVGIELVRLGDWEMLGRNMRLTMLAVLAGLVLYYAAFPVDVPQALGTVSIFLQFVLLLAFCGSLLTLVADKYRVPAISILLIWAVLLSALDLNDNHTIRPFAAEGTVSGVQPAFNDWYESRADRLEYERRGEPYPVILVAAAGGGMYAAQHAATVLARLQDRCPNFAQHVFAISGVSGGSIGAAVFASLAKRSAPNGLRRDCMFGGTTAPGEMERRANQILARDFLSPVAASGLFPDFLQRFIPVPIERFDRGRAFEAALEGAWEHALPGEDNPFKKGFLKHWTPADSARAIPALVLNTTSVFYGYRVPIRPFREDGFFADEFARLSGAIDFQSYIKAPMGNSFDITLGAAVGLSARFPWIMPAGSVEFVTRFDQRPDADGEGFWSRWIGRRTYRRLVDGGYYENSGMESVLDIVKALKRLKNERLQNEPTTKRFSLHLIAISSFQDRVEVAQGLSEPLSPLRTMLNARQKRGYLALNRGMEELGLTEKRFLSLFVLNQTDLSFPLGWQISDVTRRLISAHSGEPNAVKQLPYGVLENLGLVVAPSRENRILGFLNFGHDASCQIVKALHAGDASTLKCLLAN